MVFMSCSSSVPLPPWLEFIERVPYQTIEVKSHRIAYLDMGKGPPLIFIHGFGGSMWQWEHQLEPLSRSHRVIILDLLGSGISAKPEQPYSPRTLNDFFSHFMLTLGISRATLIGNSMGAGLAMAMALDHPDQVDALVLISGFPASIQNSVGSSSYQQFLTNPPPLWLANFGNWVAGKSATERILKEIIHNHDLITPAVIERSFQNRKRDGILEPLYSLLDHMEQWETNYGKRLSGIVQPVLLLWGEHDQIFPIEVGEGLQDVLPHAQWHKVKDSGHLPQWEQPQEVNSLILSFLKEHVG